MDYAYVLAGLGNPGSQYDGTRHNCGFLLVDALCRKAEAEGRLQTMNGSKFSCELLRVDLPELRGPWLVAKPQTFMNLSGQSVQPLLAWHKIPPNRLVVAHDELDIPAGHLRFKFGGGNAGHNGLKSISQLLGTPDFYRLRIGIGRPQHKGDVTNWVLGRPSGDDAAAIDKGLANALDVLFTFAAHGLERAARAAQQSAA
ncbi:aminoacyl-tRNA hydrolase [uncultured Desulfovibrio sp.]|uniref:aminoacyl-tRNA hydrolase n=1 Tax=uncultured Desulfovibrio sp. TaxID=167968 RepID=UPI002636864D|nr:aminoacyl-tRNA hydrolase [uncultured Desulfovibrio sp.]